MFGAWVLSGRLESGLLLEQGVGDYQSLFCTRLQQHAPVEVAIVNSMASKNSWPYSVVSFHSCVKAAHDDELILPVHSPEKGPSVAVEGLFGRGVYHECGSVHIDDGSELIALESKAEGCKAIRVFFGDAGQLSGQRVLQHEAYFGQATILLAFPRPVQCVPCSVLLEWPLFSKCTSRRAAMSMSSRASSVPPVLSVVVVGHLRRSLALCGYIPAC